MDEFFKNLRTTPVNIDENLFKSDPKSEQENKIDESQLLKQIETIPGDKLNELSKADLTRIIMNRQIKFDGIQLRRNISPVKDTGETNNVAQAKDLKGFVSQTKDEAFKVEPVKAIENVKDEIFTKIQPESRTEMFVEEKYKRNLKHIDMIEKFDKMLQKLRELSNGKRVIKEEVKNFGTKIFDSVITNTSSLLEKVTSSFGVLTMEEHPTTEEEGADRPAFDMFSIFANEEETTVEHPMDFSSEDMVIHKPVNEPLNAEDLNEKLNEISLQSQAAIEELRNQSIKIVDNARAQTNMVLENARYNFNMVTKAEDLGHQQNMTEELDLNDEEPIEETVDEIAEQYFGTGHIIDFLN